MAHFDTIRAFAEHGTAAIDPLDTGDINVVNGRTFSNKPPGVALLGAIPYRAIIAIERLRGTDIDSERVVLLNLRLCTILLCALPASLLNGLMFYAFRRDGTSPRVAMLLTGGFAFGSLTLPYAGHLTSHSLCALLVMAGWVLLSEKEPVAWKTRAAAMIGAAAVLVDVLAAPVMLMLVVMPAIRGCGWRRCVEYAGGIVAGALLVLGYNHWVQGAVDSGVFVPPTKFSQAGRIFGLFGWPSIRQLYWITFQSMRGLFPTCPAFLLCCFAPLLIQRPWKIKPSRVAILLVLCVYVVFYACYGGWNGGWCVGPRYLIPALPLLWMFARQPFERFPRVCGFLICLSIFQMLCVSAVGMLFPAPAIGPPDDSDPIRSDVIVFIQGHVNSDRGTENLGGLVHLPERFQLVPIFVLLAGFYAFAWTRPWEPLQGPLANAPIAA